MVEFGTSSAFRGWVRVRVLGYGFGVRGRKVKSRDHCALASDLVRARKAAALRGACHAKRGGARQDKADLIGVRMPQRNCSATNKITYFLLLVFLTQFLMTKFGVYSPENVDGRRTSTIL